jgi:hypothetical protein
MTTAIRRCVGAGLGAVLLCAAPLGPATAAPGDPFDRARQAAETASFVGIVQVRWLDGGAEHSERLTVQSSDGVVVVRGGNQVMAAPGSGRLVQQEDRGWDLLWSPRLGMAERPDAAGKYHTTEAAGPPVAERPTTTIEVDEHGLLRERLYLDQQSGLLLKREQFDAAGALTRAVGFDTLVFDPSTPTPAAPSSPADQAPEAVAPQRLGPPGLAPERLAGDYRRLGVYRRPGVAQVLYSDGMYELSVFEQRGRLDRQGLVPGGSPVGVGEVAGWRYPWPGGHVVLWQAGGRVFTVVSDAPLDQVLAAASSLPVPAAGSPSAMDRLRRLARAVIQPLA